MIQFWQSKEGNNSNSRLIADFIIINSIGMAWAFIYIGTHGGEKKLMEIALAISVLWGAIAGSVLFFLFGQKRTETRRKDDIPSDTSI